MICVRFAVFLRYLSIRMLILLLICGYGCLIALWIRSIREYRAFICRKWRRLPILGYRIGGRLGYVTDMLTMSDASYEQLQGLDVLVMNALRPQPHSTHQSISEALAAAERIGAKETYFIHMSHHVGLHAEINSQLPPHVHFAYDGMEINF